MSYLRWMSVVIIIAVIAVGFGCGDSDRGSTKDEQAGVCGDGVVDSATEDAPGEVCDDGNTEDGDGCSADCLSDETCGNGVVDADEVCDDGNTEDGDGCSADCTSDETCGNGVVDADEVCDDGNTEDGDGCSADCTSDETCGNGIVDADEVCDDGNTIDGDGCSADCTSDETCGNGIVDADESCDDGVDNSDTQADACRTDCSASSCGDGVVDTGEACDDGNTDGGDGCSSDCGSDETCGNGVVDTHVGEVCDDGNTEDGDGCSADCRSSEMCGNGVVDSQVGEACDDGDDNDDDTPDACRTNCQAPGCGDGVVDSGEICDDGNTQSGDGCSSDCQSDETCGNGIVDVSEDCDDGANNSDTDADACRTNCTFASCGDGVIDTGEACDDGNNVDDDGCDNQCQLAPGSVAWAQGFGGTDDDYATSVAVDASGNAYVVGEFASSSLDLGGGALSHAGSDDIFVAKFDASGNHLWSKSFGGTSYDYARSVAVDASGNAYVVGRFGSPTIDFGGGGLSNAGLSDIFVVKFDASGNHLWSKSFGGTGHDRARSVAIDASGNAYVVGMFKSSSLDFGGGGLSYVDNYDAFVAKFDASGNHQWSKSFGGTNNDFVESVAVDDSGNAYLAGEFASPSFDLGGGALAHAGGWDAFMAKFDASGNHLWSKSFGGTDGDYARSVAVDGSGNAYLVGEFASSSLDLGSGLSNVGSWDIFMAKFDASGNHQWSNSFGGTIFEYARSVAVDGSGNAYLVGEFASSGLDFGGGGLSNAGSRDIFVANFDDSGSHQWSDSFGGADNDYARSVAVGGSGHAYVVGEFDSASIDFAGSTVSNSGQFDGFLLRFAP